MALLDIGMFSMKYELKRTRISRDDKNLGVHRYSIYSKLVVRFQMRNFLSFLSRTFCTGAVGTLAVGTSAISTRAASTIFRHVGFSKVSSELPCCSPSPH